MCPRPQGEGWGGPWWPGAGRQHAQHHTERPTRGWGLRRDVQGWPSLSSLWNLLETQPHTPVLLVRWPLAGAWAAAVSRLTGPAWQRTTCRPPRGCGAGRPLPRCRGR